MLKKLTIFFSVFLMLSLISCESKIANNTDYELVAKEYIPSVPGYQTNSIIDVNTSSTSLKQKEENLLFLTADDTLNITYGWSSQEKSLSNVIMNIYYDYEMIEFKLNDSEEYVSEYIFTINNNTQIEIPVRLNNENLEFNNNIHKLLVTFTTGYEQNASDFELTTNEYGINILFDIIHDLEYSNDVENHSKNSLIPENNYDTNYGSLIFNIDYNNETQNSEYGGISNPSPELKSNSRNEIPLMYNIGKFNANEALLLLTLNNKQTMINNQNFQLIELDKKDGTANGKISFQAPSIPGKYEVIGYVILNPFEKVCENNNLIYTSYRFTLLVE